MFGRDEKVSPMRVTATQYIILGIFLILTYGLWRLQVVQSDYYSTQAERNSLRDVPILAPRGKIYDRNGRIIVDNYPSFTALLLRDSSRDLNADADLIAKGLHMDPNDIREQIKHFSSLPQYQPIFLKDDITPDEIAFIEAHHNELPELDTLRAYRRLYPLKGFMAHLIGYVGEVSETMLNQPEWDLYNPGDVVGRSGVELQYNSLLMGTNGSRQVLVNSHGKEMKELGEKPAVAGQPIKLTIDVDLQIAAEEAMQGWNGALVAMNPRNGEILAMVSRPTFEPQDFAQAISRKEWAALVDNDNHPLMNKAIQAQLAPGSTFKIIMSVAGLQEHVAQDMHVFCDGGADFYGHYYHCHAKHGMVDITKGIYQSCDTFFYTLAEKLGIERIAKYATMFGLGQKTGIDLPQEASGVMPSEEWKIRNFKEKWFAGETISVGIGQGSVAVTPVQLARALGGIASGGLLVRPHVAFPDDLPANMRPAADSEVHVPLDPKNWEIITDAMAEVTNVGGTAAASHLEGIDFAGKTGTAQTISAAAKAKVKGSKAQYRNNAWFVGVEPRRSPEIVVCALLEQGDEGPVAARVVSKVIKAYVEEQHRQPQNVASKQNKTEVGAVWTSTDEDGEPKFQGGHFFLDVDRKRAPLATAAPGLE